MKRGLSIAVNMNKSIIEAMDVIDKGQIGFAAIIDHNQRLVGVITDADVRKAILRRVDLSLSVESIMNTSFVSAKMFTSTDKLEQRMLEKGVRQLPLVDDKGRLVDVVVYSDFLPMAHESLVVIMAGGLGNRLRPLTDKHPKPLLKVGNKPILETILKNFKEYGFMKFYISVNYRAEMIEEYFGDGSRWGINIQYIHENKRLGTAGSLALLPEKPSAPFLVMNGDLLTKVNFQHLLDFHIEHRAHGTMCIREYVFQVPFGVVEVEKHRLTGIGEKPINQFFVNAGIYAFEPNVLELVPKNSFFDMPDLFQKLIEQGRETIVFPIREYWLDVGRMVDYERAHVDYEAHFCNL